MESCRRKFFKRDGTAADIECKRAFGLVVGRHACFESYIVESQRVFAVKAVNYILAVAFCINKRVRAVIAP